MWPEMHCELYETGYRYTRRNPKRESLEEMKQSFYKFMEKHDTEKYLIMMDTVISEGVMKRAGYKQLDCRKACTADEFWLYAADAINEHVNKYNYSDYTITVYRIDLIKSNICDILNNLKI